jgi:hypothetical protein
MRKYQKGKIDPAMLAQVKTINTRIKSAGGKERYQRMSYALMDQITGSLNASTLLSHLMFLTGRGKLEDGWIYKTATELEEELGLTQRMQEGCRRSLVERGLIDEKRAGNNGRLHFRVNLDAVNAAFNQLYPGDFPPLHDSTEGANAQDVDSTFGGACFDNTGEEESTNGGNEKPHVWPIGTAQSDDENDTILNNIINTSTTNSGTEHTHDDAEVVGSFTTTCLKTLSGLGPSLISPSTKCHQVIVKRVTSASTRARAGLAPSGSQMALTSPSSPVAPSVSPVATRNSAIASSVSARSYGAWQASARASDESRWFVAPS